MRRCALFPTAAPRWDLTLPSGEKQLRMPSSTLAGVNKVLRACIDVHILGELPRARAAEDA